MARARVAILIAAVCFGTTGTAQALGPDATPVTVGAVRIIDFKPFSIVNRLTEKTVRQHPLFQYNLLCPLR